MRGLLRPAAAIGLPVALGAGAGCIGVYDRGTDSAPVDPSEPTTPYEVQVEVTLDGAPAVDVPVMQAGTATVVRTNNAGRVSLTIDPSVSGTHEVIAGAPTAWNAGVVVESRDPITLALHSFSTVDNPDYVFADPGEDEMEPTSDNCSHCHLSIHVGWRPSAHANAAADPAVQGVYQGADFAASAEDCAGTWGALEEPGTGAAVEGCVVAPAVRALDNAGGGCADCHAPAIGGATVPGHDLLEARDLAYTYGVSCDVCHKVSTVTVGAAPGTAGWLTVLRPSDPTPSKLLGAFHPLQFGPYLDVVNPYMGSVQRDHFRDPAFCGGCHDHAQPVLDPSASIDLARWPSATLPIASTYAEWLASGTTATCEDCHRSPLRDVGNSADLDNVFELRADSSAGWYRPAGDVIGHEDVGPQQSAEILANAAMLAIESKVADGTLTAAVTVTNSGAGHALPTGEPFRNLVLRVEAECDGVPLIPTGGDIVPGWGGAEAERHAPERLDSFPEAAVGDTLRLARTVGWVDYTGPGPFGDGTFTAAEKGLPAMDFLAALKVTAVGADGTLTVDAPETLAAALAEADTAFLVRDAAEAAGAPGFGFAKVLVAADGATMVPHFRAVDVQSDDRLAHNASFTSTHRFAAPCSSPKVHATLDYRAFPLGIARTYGWDVGEARMEERSD